MRSLTPRFVIIVAACAATIGLFHFLLHRQLWLADRLQTARQTLDIALCSERDLRSAWAIPHANEDPHRGTAAAECPATPDACSTTFALTLQRQHPELLLRHLCLQDNHAESEPRAVERTVLEFFLRHPTATSWSGVVTLKGVPHVALAVPSRRDPWLPDVGDARERPQAVLQGPHGLPARADVARLGPAPPVGKASLAIDLAMIPLEPPSFAFASPVLVHSLAAGCEFVLFGLVIAVVFHRHVGVRLRRITENFRAQAHENRPGPLPAIEGKGHDEIHQLVATYNRMAVQLAAMHESLEERVKHRTAELEGINRIFRETLSCHTEEQIAKVALNVAEEVTHSKASFLGRRNAAGRMDTLAVGQRCKRACRVANAAAACADMPLRSYWGRVMRECRSVLVNAPKRDPEITGLPHGHIAIDNFLGVPLCDGGQAIGMLGVANAQGGYDDDDRQILESLAMAVVAALNRNRVDRALTDAKQAAEAANRAKSEFLANMSHEIRTPMTSVLGYVEWITAECPKRCGFGRDEMAGHLHVVTRNAECLLRIINDVLDLSKIEAGQFAVERVSCATIDALRDAVTLAEVSARAKGIFLQLRFDSPIPATIVTDPWRFRQILTNLLANAVKFTERGTITLAASHHATINGGGMLRVEVTDCGIGIPLEKQSRLFQPFYQVETGSNRSFGGTGLGLAISRRLAQVLGGDIEVESRIGQGSTFRVTIDAGPAQGIAFLAPEEAAAHQSQLRPALQQEKQPLAGTHVLLAEDGPDNQRLITMILEKAGARVEVADNGEAAVTAAHDAQPPHDLILMDMQMPILDGYGAARKLRAIGYMAPIIALTANALSDDREKCLAAGCDDYLTKPFDRHVFLDLVRRWCRGAPPPAAAPANASSNAPSSPAASTLPTPAAPLVPAEIPAGDGLAIAGQSGGSGSPAIPPSPKE